MITRDQIRETHPYVWDNLQTISPKFGRLWINLGEFVSKIYPKSKIDTIRYTSPSVSFSFCSSSFWPFLEVFFVAVLFGSPLQPLTRDVGLLPIPAQLPLRLHRDEVQLLRDQQVYDVEETLGHPGSVREGVGWAMTTTCDSKLGSWLFLFQASSLTARPSTPRLSRNSRKMYPT